MLVKPLVSALSTASALLFSLSAVTAHSTSSTTSSCLDKITPTCTYPPTNSKSDITNLCQQMPFMSACSLRNMCAHSKFSSTLKTKPYCRPFDLLAGICYRDTMYRMRGCANYNTICRSGKTDSSSLNTNVQQCHSATGLANMLNTKTVNDRVKSICEAMPGMDGCDRCKFEVGKTYAACDLLSVYGRLCFDMPEMYQCGEWMTLCKSNPELGMCKGELLDSYKTPVYDHEMGDDFVQGLESSSSSSSSEKKDNDEESKKSEDTKAEEEKKSNASTNLQTGAILSAVIGAVISLAFF